MTKLSALGASLLILSLAAPAQADDVKPTPKIVAAPAKGDKPMTPKAQSSETAHHPKDDEPRRPKRSGRKAREGASP